MKKTILFSAVLLSATGFSQINKGRSMIGLGFSHNSNTQKSGDTTGLNRQTDINKSFNSNIRFGHFVSDGVMIGVFGGYTNSTYATEVQWTGGPATSSSSKQLYDGLSAGVFTRYYKMIGTSRFAVFGEFSAQYWGGTERSTTTVKTASTITSYRGNRRKNQGFNAMIKPGLTYFATPKIAVEATFGNVGYGYNKRTTFTDKKEKLHETTNSGISTALNFSLQNVALGINFYFGD
jgi:hypothetical protein